MLSYFYHLQVYKTIAQKVAREPIYFFVNFHEHIIKLFCVQFYEIRITFCAKNRQILIFSIVFLLKRGQLHSCDYLRNKHLMPT